VIELLETLEVNTVCGRCRDLKTGVTGSRWMIFSLHRRVPAAHEAQRLQTAFAASAALRRLGVA